MYNYWCHYSHSFVVELVCIGWWYCSHTHACVYTCSWLAEGLALQCIFIMSCFIASIKRFRQTAACTTSAFHFEIFPPLSDAGNMVCYCPVQHTSELSSESENFSLEEHVCSRSPVPPWYAESSKYSWGRAEERAQPSLQSDPLPKTPLQYWHISMQASWAHVYTCMYSLTV